MAVDAARELDTVEDIEMFWTVGDERPNVGRAVPQHLMHTAADVWSDRCAEVAVAATCRDHVRCR
ncbi:hypothetical protein GCM10010377_23890 [Streptomyces viridiviolaceus]|nr:hypothetical protein GCM10010377_23890 [Streptomyces viridiviolaceus]